MKKFAVALGVAAVAVVSGCKDPEYKRAGASHVQNDVKSADTTVAQTPAPAPQCTCAPGTRHTSPCTCGGVDCRCVVEQKSAPQHAAPAPRQEAPAAEPEYTVYVVRSGDYLAKLSKRFNVTISSIKRLNNMTSDTVRVGQKLKIPGKVDVGAAPEPVKAAAPKKAKTAKAYAPYSGATKEYVVKSGDTLGSIALGSGISVRQLKELNGLSDERLRIGQKLKIPAEKVVKKAAEKKADKVEKKADAAADNKQAAEAAVPVEKPAEEAPAAAPAEQAAGAAVTTDTVGGAVVLEAAPATSTYVVQEGDDLTGVSIRWGVSAAEIRAMNNLGESDQIKPGQILKLPAEVQQ